MSVVNLVTRVKAPRFFAGLAVVDVSRAAGFTELERAEGCELASMSIDTMANRVNVI